MFLSISDDKQIQIGLVQINNSFSGQSYLPYAAALLQTYVQKKACDPEKYLFLPSIYKRTKISEIVDGLKSADIVGFSTYVWNAQISLEVARRLKSINPKIFIIFGGPHVPDFSEEFLRENQCVDICVHNEGEATFLALLEASTKDDLASLEGISFLDSSNNQYVKTTARPRFRDLDEVPSPFLEGAFDELMAQNSNEKWIGLWETNRGCPFRCTFCDWGSATAAKVTKFGEDRLIEEAEWFGSNKIEYIFCCDANFGMQKRDIELAKALAKVKKDVGFPRVFSVQGTKNQTEKAYEMHKVLSDSGLNNGVVLSMQSMDENTLVAIKRDNISLDTYETLQKRFTEDGVDTYSDLILGLPGETYESFVEGVDQLITNGQHNRIQFNNLSILPNAEMGSPAYIKEHKIETIKSKIINLHGEEVFLDDDVEEFQLLVVSTASLSREQWQRTRCFSWMIALLHFDKLFQLPLLIANSVFKIKFRDAIEAFMDADSKKFPTISNIVQFFKAEAANIQRGGAEWTYSEKYLGIYWTADEHVFIDLIDNDNFDSFYREAESILFELIGETITPFKLEMLKEAVSLNEKLVRRPFVTDDIYLNLNFDLMSFWNLAKVGDYRPVQVSENVITINRSANSYDDLQDWCREVVWWGNKRGAYLYPNESRTIEVQLAGHH